MILATGCGTQGGSDVFNNKKRAADESNATPKQKIRFPDDERSIVTKEEKQNHLRVLQIPQS